MAPSSTTPRRITIYRYVNMSQLHTLRTLSGVGSSLRRTFQSCLRWWRPRAEKLLDEWFVLLVVRLHVGGGVLSGSFCGSLGSLQLRPSSSSSLCAGNTGQQSSDAAAVCLSRSSSMAAAEVFSAGSGVLLHEDDEVDGRSPRSRRCPFVIGVAGGTGEIMQLYQQLDICIISL